MPKTATRHRSLDAAAALLIAAPWHGLAVAQPAPVPPPITQAHADCARPQYASDVLVCSDAALRAADAEIAAIGGGPPALADGAIWEDDAAWLRRRSLCAFNTDHRGCLVAAYGDRRAFLGALAAPPAVPLRCTGPWQGRPLAASAIIPGQAIAIRHDGLLLGVATTAHAPWQPALGWQAVRHRIRLRTQGGRQFDCHLAPR